MKIKFKIENKKGKEITKKKLLAAETGLDADIYNVDTTLDELSRIVFSDLDLQQLNKIKSITKTVAEVSEGQYKDGIPIFKELILAVNTIEEMEVDGRYQLTLYLQDIIYLKKNNDSYLYPISTGNFEFLLDFAGHHEFHPHLPNSYLAWRNNICKQFPEEKNLLSQFQFEENLGAKKANLFRYEFALFIRKNIANICPEQTLFDVKEDITLDQDRLKLQAEVHKLKQKRM